METKIEQIVAQINEDDYTGSDMIREGIEGYISQGWMVVSMIGFGIEYHRKAIVVFQRTIKTNEHEPV